MKRYALLIELLIALLLTATLLGGLSTLIFHFTGVSKEIDEALEEPIKIALTEKRLAKILRETLTLHSSDPGIVFIYNRGIDPDRRFSADVLGRLYVEGQKLILATWPNPARFADESPPCLTEVIQEGVEKWSYEFYNPPPLEGRKDNPPIPYGWQSKWQLEWKALPMMCRVTVNDQRYTIPIRNANHLLIFPKKQ